LFGLRKLDVVPVFSLSGMKKIPGMHSITLTGNLADLHSERIRPARVRVEQGRISAIEMLGDHLMTGEPYILPGFIDSHVHIESSMLVPSEFARLAVVHGTVATVSDPHEIANVCGMEGVEFMIRNGSTVPFKFYFGAPSCVPATGFETAGAYLDAAKVRTLLQRADIRYLSEMMNFPGVLNHDSEVMKKIQAAQELGKPVDGHAPGLRGEAARAYAAAGISTDHECVSIDEATEKIDAGMKIIIREGSAAKNFEALFPLLHDYPDRIMFCSDDKHPDSLVMGHINQLCARSVAKGIDLFKVLKAACLNPVLHYGLDVGLLRPGDPADFILVSDLKDFRVLKTFINGEPVAENGSTRIKATAPDPINQFSCNKKNIQDFALPANAPVGTRIPVIEALDGQLITNRLLYEPKVINGMLESDIEDDILKIVVVNRYRDAPVAKAFIRNFKLLRGAIASSVAHDSHNIVAVGVDDESICRAVNAIIDSRGGISCCAGSTTKLLPLPVAGLMSAEDGYEVAEQYTRIDRMVKDELRSGLSAPFMTLSFMALLVIPHLKLSDQGLFDGDRFSFVG